MSAATRAGARRIVRQYGNISGWERAMWRAQEAAELADACDRAREASHATLTAELDAWYHAPVEALALAPVSAEPIALWNGTTL